MKRFSLTTLVLLQVFLGLCFYQNLQAAYIKNLPLTLLQPDGTHFHCFATGDEYYNWLHDAENYTIIRNPRTGYYVYAILVNKEIKPSIYIVGIDNPSNTTLVKGVNIPSSKMLEIRNKELKKIPERPFVNSYRSTIIRNHGVMNNLVIFIRFSDESEYTQVASVYSDMFNNSPGTVSMKNYFKEVSYDSLSINTSFYPSQVGSTVLSYQDIFPRSYFQPYDSLSNTNGYQPNDRTIREDSLLLRAVNAIKSQIPISLNLDYDDNGYVDNICFIVSGDPTAWSTLLWPHKSSLYLYDVFIGSKRVWSFNFQLNNYLLNNSGVGVLCHEMFHSLGAPDLYHYSYDGFVPAGPWDIMENEGAIPQSMCAFMKNKYGNWIDSIPLIRTSGTYSLHPVASSFNNAYKIELPNTSEEYFIVEYRKKTGVFESSIPESGLLVYRINTTCGNGNADGPPDEVYFFRPGGSPSNNGVIINANFSSNVGRTSFNNTSDPYPFLTNGTSAGINIYNISSSGNTISFNVLGVEAPFASSDSAVDITNNSATIYGTVNPKGFSTVVSFEYGLTTNYGNIVTAIQSPLSINSNTVVSASLSGLNAGAQYHFRIKAESQEGITYSTDYVFNTECMLQSLPVVQGFNSSFIPVCWNKELIIDPLTPGEYNAPANITFEQSSISPILSNAFEGSHFVKFNSMDASSGAEMRLVSSPFKTIGRHNINISIEWFHSPDGLGQYDNEGAIIQWSIDGNNWNDVDTVNRTDANSGWAHKVWFLPPAADNQLKVFVAFKFVSQYGYNCYMDNVVISDSLPAANFSTNTPVVYQFDNVSFSDLSSPNITSHWWKFTGATPDTSTLQNPSGIIYRYTGNFPVKLTVANAFGRDSVTKYNFIMVKSIVDAGVDKNIVCFGSTQLNASMHNNIGSTLLHFRWSPSYGLSDTTIINPIASPSVSTTYIISAIDTNFIATDTVVVNVVPLSVSAGSDVSINCQDSTLLNATTNHVTGTFVRINTPQIMLYNVGAASFGADIFSTYVNKNALYISSSNGCSSFPANIFNNKIAVIDRGTCTFTLKALNAQAAGAKAVIIVNNQPGNAVMQMGAGTSSELVVIPVVSVGIDDGSNIKTMLNADTVNISIGYDGGPLTFLWTPSEGLNNPALAKPKASPHSNTTYTATVSDGLCTSSGSVRVNINLPSVFLGNDTIYCQGSSIMLNAHNPGSSYIWNDSSTDSTLLVNTSDTFFVMVNNPNGCFANDTIIISELPIPYAADSIDGSINICQASKNVVYISSVIDYATTYEWNIAPANSATYFANNNNVAIDFDDNFVGIFLLSVNGKNVCGVGNPHRKRITIMPLPETPQISTNGYILESSSQIGNQWYIDTNEISGATTQHYTPLQSGNYHVVIVGTNGCYSFPSNNIYYQLGINDNTTSNDIKLYPNPAEDYFVVEFKGKINEQDKCFVYNINGQELIQRTINFKITKVNIKDLSKGIYFIKIIGNNKNVVMKLVKR